MRNITVFLVLVIILNCAHFAAAEEQEQKSRLYTFSLGTKFGMLYGQTEEIVYPVDTKAELLSQLLWDIKPVFYYGLSMDVSRTNPMEKWGFFSTLFLKNAIPGKSGKMEDMDWQSKENTSLTNYSIHDNHTNKLFFCDISAGLSFPIKHILLIKTYLSVSYMHFDFSGYDGYMIYSPPYGTGEKKPIDGKVINYTQDWLTINPGVALGYYFLRYFYTELFFQISPFVFCRDLDQHLMTDTQYKDYMRGGLLTEPGLRFSFFAGKWFELSLDFSWRHIGGTKGKTWQGTIGSADFEQGGDAGAGLSFTDTSFSFKIRL